MSSVPVDAPSPIPSSITIDASRHSPRNGEAGLYLTFAAATLLAALLGAALFWPRTAPAPLESTRTGAAPRANALMLDEPVPIR